MVRKKRYKKLKKLTLLPFVFGIVIIIGLSFVLMLDLVGNEYVKADLVNDYSDLVSLNITSQHMMEDLFEICYYDYYIPRTSINSRTPNYFYINLSHSSEFMLEIKDELVYCTENYFAGLKQNISVGIFNDVRDDFPSFVVLTLLDMENETIIEHFIEN